MEIEAYNDNPKLIYAPRLLASLVPDASSRETSTKLRRKRNVWLEPKPRGLWNHGQSCHLGSVIAALSAVPILRAWLREHSTTSESRFSLVQQYILECAPSSSSRGALDPRPVLTLLANSGWKSRHAQDAHETMARLLEILEDGFAAIHNPRILKFGLRPPYDSAWCRTLLCQSKLPISSATLMRRVHEPPFSALTASSNHCHTCGYSSPTSFQASLLLTLPIPRFEHTISELFYNAYMRAEEIEMRCGHCSQIGRHTRSTGMKRFPEILVLHLQKAIYGSGVARLQNRPVALTQTLTIPVRGRKGVGRFETYSLCSVVRHKGVANTRNSHFDAVLGRGCGNAREGLLGLEHNSRWHLVDDEHVSNCIADTALIPSLTYLMVYQRSPAGYRLPAG